MSFLDMTECVNTGRKLTEWFEYPEFTPEQILEMAYEHAGVAPDFKMGHGSNRNAEQQDAFIKIMAFSNKHKKRKWVNSLTQTEVAYRMNEASKMVSPENVKFLDEETQKRTGLELNPLWQMEVLVRSGVLSPKEQITALKELAAYTHSKAPSINFNNNSNLNPEDWLLELAKDEYKVIGVDIPLPEKQMVERGAGKAFENRLQKKLTQIENLAEHGQSEFERLAQEVDAEWIEPDD